MKKESVEYICDRCGSSEGTKPHTVVIDGQLYEIDLCQFDAVDILWFIKDLGRAYKGPVKPRSNADRRRTAAIREWAYAHGKITHLRGRLPTSVVKSYEESHD